MHVIPDISEIIASLSYTNIVIRSNTYYQSHYFDSNLFTAFDEITGKANKQYTSRNQVKQSNSQYDLHTNLKKYLSSVKYFSNRVNAFVKYVLKVYPYMNC